MFTGIVEETGVVQAIGRRQASIELAIRAVRCAAGLKPGESLAVNGCCLTVARVSRRPRTKGRLLGFDLLEETWSRTNFKSLGPQSLVNLERALPAQGRLSGHFVTGHIDGTGRILRWEKIGADWLLEVKPAGAVMEFIIPKGSVAVDGISLTVAKVARSAFQVWIIPHTFEVTNLRRRTVGEEVNLEADLLGKYVKQFLPPHRGS